MCIYTPVCPSLPRQNIDHYSVPILSKPVYCEIVQDTPLFTDSDSALSLSVNSEIQIFSSDYHLIEYSFAYHFVLRFSDHLALDSVSE